MIGKTAYFFWQGEQMSWLRYITLRSFVYHNPDWKAVLYLSSGADYTKKWTTPEEQENYHKKKYENYLPKVFDLDVEVVNYNPESYHPAQNSDLACWDILSKNSGIFFDMDIVFVKSINKFWFEIRDSDSVLDLCKYYCGPDFILHSRIGMLASAGDNSLFQGIYNFHKDSSMFGYQELGRDLSDAYICEQMSVESLTNRPSQPVLEGLAKKHNQTITNLGKYHTIYPWDWMEDAPRFYDLHTSVEGCYFGIHWYGGRPVSQEFNGFLTEHNFKDHKNTICHYAEKSYL